MGLAEIQNRSPVQVSRPGRFQRRLLRHDARTHDILRCRSHKVLENVQYLHGAQITGGTR